MKTITTVEVNQKLAAGEQLNLIDVREAAELVEGKIPGVLHIPLGLLDFRMQELDKSMPYIIVCHSGGRSAQATDFLTYHGYDATNMNGGMMMWPGEVE
ncbi:MAG: rhodanese-like domain-containing protein [Kurthia sp.]|nr:rhodanese-like domain-containing protein [Candidatus Kurthia equi]